MNHIPRALFAAVLAVTMLLPSAAYAGRLAELPWDENVVDDELRGAVRRALSDEARSMSEERNDANKKFIHVRFNEQIDLNGGDRAVSYVTVQRCLEDRMVTEYWRYVLAPKGGGPDYEIVERVKEFEKDDFLPELMESPDQARKSKAFSFEHDLLKVRADAGSYLLKTRGGVPTGMMLEASGRLRIDPVSEYERTFFERRLKEPLIDTEIEAIEIEFYEGDTTFTDLVGDAAAGSGSAGGGLADMRKRAIGEKDDEREYVPSEYSLKEHEIQEGRFSLSFKTKDFGWVGYLYNPNGVVPTGVREILVYREKQGFSFRVGADDFDLVSHYFSPESRDADLRDRENREGLSFASPYRYDAMFEIDEDGIVATVDVDLRVLIDTDRLGFGVFGGGRLRYAKQDLVRDLPHVPSGGGHEILFPEPLVAGETVRLRIGYETKWPSGSGVGKVNEGFWIIPRGGFLPFSGVLSDPSFMRFVIRTEDDYQHISIGSRLEEEITGGHRYTEWAADYAVNFPTIIIGKYYDPVVREVDGVKITGYMTKTFEDGLTPSRDDMKPHVDRAADSLRLFADLYGVPYPYDELKLVGTPSQFLSAQSPSSIVYVGSGLFLPPAMQVNMFESSGLDPKNVSLVTPHEIAHQWWGGIVSNRNNDHYWFVESMADVGACYYEKATREDGECPNSVSHWRRSTMASDWSCAIHEDMFRMEAGGVQPLRYTKGPYVMHMLEEYFGERRFVEFMRNVFENHAGDLISTWDLQRTAEETFQVDMSWFFDAWIRGFGVPKVGYEYSTRQAEDGQNWVISGRLTQVVTLKGDEKQGQIFENLLVPIEIELASGEIINERVVLDGPEKPFDISVPGKPRTIKFNPDDKIIMEVRPI